MSSGYVLYNYTPSVAAAAIFVIIFTIATCGHIFLAAKHKLKFLTAFILGGVFEAIGYIARAVSANQSPDYSVMPYALQSLFILLAPSFFAASVYMILGRIIRQVDGNSNSLIRASRLTKIFVCGDILSFLIQSAGIFTFILFGTLYGLIFSNFYSVHQEVECFPVPTRQVA